MNLLQRGNKELKEPKIGQIVWFLKNLDIKYRGILYGTVKEKRGSDYLVDVANGGETLASPSRVNMIYGEENNLGCLKERDDDCYDQSKLVNIEVNPGPSNHEGVKKNVFWETEK